MAGSPLWKPDHEGGAAAGGRGDAHPAVVLRHDGRDDRQPEAAAAAAGCGRARGRRGRSARTPWSRPPRARPARGLAPRGRRRRRRGPTATSTGVPSGVCSRAFATRLVTTWRSWDSVPRTASRRDRAVEPEQRDAALRRADAGVGDGIRASTVRSTWVVSHDGGVVDAGPGSAGPRRGRSSGSTRPRCAPWRTRRRHCRARRPAGRARRTRAPWRAGCAARARRRRRTGASAPRWPRARRRRTRCGSASR